jgi:hypothetical protein
MAFDHDRQDPISRRRAATLVSGSITARLAVVAIAALVLASCGTSTNTTSSTSLQGVPTIGISVAMQKVACTTNNACVAVGASSASLAPTAVGEYRQASGHWRSIAVPSVASAQIIASSCWDSDCLFGGAQSTGDLLWDYNASSHTMLALTPPTGGVGVSAIDCFATLSCMLVDNRLSGQPQISSTIDGGTTWTIPVPVPWASGATINALACNSATNCLASATTSTGAVGLEVTLDGGTTWAQRSTPSSWTSLTSLGCRARTCVALASTSTGSRVVRSNSFGRTWSSTSLGVSASALACTTTSHCVAVGGNSSATPWLGQVTRRVVTPRSLRYVPSILLDVACGDKICAAVGVTTLLSVVS